MKLWNSAGPGEERGFELKNKSFLQPPQAQAMYTLSAFYPSKQCCVSFVFETKWGFERLFQMPLSAAAKKGFVDGQTTRLASVDGWNLHGGDGLGVRREEGR
ncbi:MAG: hypothetical protein FWG75_03205 [Cystobacterineae bacterium]|nr:hypothetical protein [Cystobacterineae bacterium]